MAGTILITGANRGIGLELAGQYARDGWRVLACCRRPEEARELESLREQGAASLSIHRLDVADFEGMEKLSGELREERIDILFSNAGVFGPENQSFGAVDTPGWLETFRVNAVAPLRLAAAFVEQVARSDRKIVAVMGTLMASLADNRSGGLYAYRSSKAAAHMVARSMAADLRERGITVAILHPGWVRTDMGGADAPLTPQESVAGLRRVLGSVTLQDSGGFFNYDGRELPW